jgi:hypothetical protein
MFCVFYRLDVPAPVTEIFTNEVLIPRLCGVPANNDNLQQKQTIICTWGILTQSQLTSPHN